MPHVYGMTKSPADPDVLARIATFNATREQERLALKYRAMRSNVFAFFRGTAHLFWEDFPTGESSLDVAPAAWACGDLHLENFGSFRGDNRLTYFDLNDFDEAALAPATFELARFITSVHLAAASLQLLPSQATELSKTFVSSYAGALVDGKARWIERATAQGMVKDLLRTVKQRTREELLDLRTDRRGPRRKLKLDGRHALAVSDADRTQVIDCLHAYGDACGEPKFFKVVDIARRIAGTGSLGVKRFVVLVRGRGSPDGNMLLDLKEARPSVLAPHVTLPQPAWANEAERVVRVQHRMQAISPALLEVVKAGDLHFVMRELQPDADRLALEHWHGKLGRLRRVMVAMGCCTAWSQLRSSSRDGSAGADELIAFGRSKSWHRPLLRYAREYTERAAADWHRFAASPEHPSPART